MARILTRYSLNELFRDFSMVFEFYKKAFADSPIAQVLIDPWRDRFVVTNKAACKFFGLESSELSQCKVSQFYAQLLPAWIVFTEKALNEGVAWSNDLRFYMDHKNGRQVELHAVPLQFENTSLLLYSFQDARDLEENRLTADRQIHYQSGIGSWNRMAEVFQEFERDNQLLLDAAGEGIYGVDTEGRTTFLNPAGERMLGWSASEILNKDIHAIIHHSHRNGKHYKVSECPIYQAFRDGIQRNVDSEVFWTKEGKPIDVEYTSTPIKERGIVVGAVVVFRDITQKRLDQARLLSALDEVETLKNRLEQEKAYLQEEIRSEFNHHEIVGKSAAVGQILQKIQMVAPTDATTLITGESGTGKELIARAIHELSNRRDRPLIRVNCAAIPADLFESEMFGHAKGAFTGATINRIGRFELADGGTLFLDEVGEIPLALQSKLLGVLQEQLFERVGESKTRHVNVRIIAATNRDLKTLAKQGAFREDLYFRLNVFPIESVPLRERQEDIPVLTQHFLHRAGVKANKMHLKISQREMDRLVAYPWPGNIRELENVIERQVILAQGDKVTFHELTKTAPASTPVETGPRSLAAVLTDEQRKHQEKANILLALKRSKGKVFGDNGAAELLDVKPTTLCSRIKKFGIDVSRYKTTSSESFFDSTTG